MPSRRVISTAALSLLLLQVTACRDGDTPLEPGPGTGPASAARALEEGARLRPAEEGLRGMARRSAAFAGYYYDDAGDLVLLTTDPAGSGGLREAAPAAAGQASARRDGRAVAASRTVVRKAEFSFAELSGWRDRIEAEVFRLDPVTMVDLDERENRITVGVRTPADRGEVTAAVRRLGFGPRVVAIEVVGEAQPQARSGSVGEAVTGCVALTQVCRPLIGGYQVTFARDGGPPSITCTAGFGAISAGEPRLVTASHCSDNEWDLDGTVYHQPFAFNPVGAESRDPRGWSCEWTYRCRYSDATLLTASVPVDVGYIARPYAGSVQVNPVARRFTVAAYRDAVVGERVYLVGRTSGLIQGRVDKTCTSVKKTWQGRWHKVVCTDISDYDSQNGDSGGPVFIWDGSSELVTLVGLHFGSNPLYDHAYFSPISGIRHSDDLGGIEVRAPGYRTSDGGGGGIGGGCNDCPFPE